MCTTLPSIDFFEPHQLRYLPFLERGVITPIDGIHQHPYQESLLNTSFAASVCFITVFATCYRPLFSQGIPMGVLLFFKNSNCGRKATTNTAKPALRWRNGCTLHILGQTDRQPSRLALLEDTNQKPPVENSAADRIILFSPVIPLPLSKAPPIFPGGVSVLDVAQTSL